MSVVFSHFSVFTVSPHTPATICFPGAGTADASLGLGTDRPDFLGYVRCQKLVPRSWKSRNQRWAPEDKFDPTTQQPKLPFRDYPSSLRVDAKSIGKGRKNLLCLSARNVANEVSYNASIDGMVFQTARDTTLPPSWPVLAVRRPTPGTMRICRVEEIDANEDWVSGLPLVIDGRPMSRDFLVANASDCAHLFVTDPGDKFGPRGSWLPISEAWNDERTRVLAGHARTDAEIAAAVDAVAAGFGLAVGSDAPGAVLPHSIFAERADGTLQFLVLSASLWSAAQFLAATGYRSAAVLDQSGSLNHYVTDEKGDVRILVSTPNARPEGTCFIAIEMDGYLANAKHLLVR